MARCECGLEITAEGCNCTFAPSDCFDIQGSGSEDNPYVVVPILDPDEDNLLECTDDGLLGSLPYYLSDPPACHIYRTSNQTFAHDDADVVVMNEFRWDTDTMYDEPNFPSRITFTTAGVYVVTFVCVWNKNAAGDRQVWIRKNGTDSLVSDSKHAGDADLFVGHSVICQEEFEAGDYVEAVAKQDSGGNLLLLADRETPILSAVFRRRPTA